MKTNQQRIVSLIESVHVACGYERATVCARDCLLQWDLNLLDETILAWENRLQEIQHKESQVDENRHGAWVPGIPL